MSKNQSASHWVKCISTHGNIRGVAIEATSLIQEIVDVHQVKGEAARGLGEAIIGALLIASYCKQGQKVNLNIQGTGLFQQALVDAYPDGKVRGYIVERESPDMADSEFGPWGSGLLSVLRTRNEEGGKPYIGTVPLLTGHLAKDLSFYWVQSEQIPSAVGLVIHFEKDRVSSASGFLVQALPGANPQEVQVVEKHIQEFDSFSENLKDHSNPVLILSKIFQSTAFMVVEEKKLEFKCNCSLERVLRALVLVGAQELQSILSEDKLATVRCDFCSQEYRVDEEMLLQLIATALEHTQP